MTFPLPRYFQVHFQHIHERTDDVYQELAEIKNLAAQVLPPTYRLINSSFFLF